MPEYTTDELKEQRREILNENIGRYKFLRANRLDGLSQEEIWMSDPKKFNDPFDLNFNIEDLIYRGPFQNEQKLRRAFAEIFLENSEITNHWFYDDYFVETLKNWIDGHALSIEIIEAFKLRLSAFGVSCFAQDWDVPLMWSHYTDSHKGICVEYAVNQMKFARARENLTFGQYNVRYTTDVPTTCVSELLFTPHRVLGNVIATKHADWSYEREWRLVHFTDKENHVPMPKHMQISALIVGLNFDMAEIETVISKAACLKVPAYKTVRGHGRMLLQSL